MDGRAAGESEALRAADNFDHVSGLTGPWPAYELPEQGVEKVRDTHQAQEAGRAQIETLELEGDLHVPLEAVYGDREVGRDQHRHQG